MKVSNLLTLAGYASIAFSAYRYFTAEDKDAKRDALFVGHWAPTFFILAVGAENREYRGQDTKSLDANR